jgi:trimethylamine--corrinoid protein Co-methyltransferase
MLDFESCLSLEKLVLDNEICGMSYRMIAGIEPKEDFPALPIFQELLKERNLIIADHTRKYIKSEIYTTGPAIDRKNRSRWERDGSLTLFERAGIEVDKLLKSYKPYNLPEDIKRQIIKLMETEARRHKLHYIKLDGNIACLVNGAGLAMATISASRPSICSTSAGSRTSRSSQAFPSTAFITPRTRATCKARR